MSNIYERKRKWGVSAKSLGFSWLARTFDLSHHRQEQFQLLWHCVSRVVAFSFLMTECCAAERGEAGPPTKQNPSKKEKKMATKIKILSTKAKAFLLPKTLIVASIFFFFLFSLSTFTTTAENNTCQQACMYSTTAQQNRETTFVCLRLLSLSLSEIIAHIIMYFWQEAKNNPLAAAS